MKQQNSKKEKSLAMRIFILVIAAVIILAFVILPLVSF